MEISWNFGSPKKWEPCTWITSILSGLNWVLIFGDKKRQVSKSSKNAQVTR